MNEALTYLLANWEGIISILTGAVALASAIAALTPTPKDDSIVRIVRKLVDMIALNMKNAKPEQKQGK